MIIFGVVSETIMLLLIADADDGVFCLGHF